MADDKPGTGCPVQGAPTTRTRSLLGRQNKDWWPDALPVDILHQHGVSPDPMGQDFDYAAAFAMLDYAALKAELAALMTRSQDWWPADYGHYGPLMIRMAWHAAGTYRVTDGRGGANSGQQRFEPLSSWPDNGNLDKARRLLWPIKQKYGKCISWADLLILAGNVAIETMGGPVFGYGGGRRDVYQSENDTFWGVEQIWVNMGARTRLIEGETSELEGPLAAIQMGLIYVNPEGPGGDPDPMLSARDIKATFLRMAMNSEETVALIAGGHAFGKAHGAQPSDTFGGPPADEPLHRQGLGWLTDSSEIRHGHITTSGIEGAWSNNPTRWGGDYFRLLFKYDYELAVSPAGAKMWSPVNPELGDLAPDARDPAQRVPTMMTTADMALKVDPEFRAISERFRDNQSALDDAFARAWFKLTHRDMGPRARYLGPEVPAETLIWQDPVPAGSTPDPVAVTAFKDRVLASGLGIAALVKTAWASASTYRRTDHRGGANGARIALSPQKDWAVNEPAQLAGVLSTLDALREDLSLADAIVLAGSVAVEKAAKEAGFDVAVPFLGGRGDAVQDWTDVESFAWMEPKADGFRNYLGTRQPVRTEELLLDRASLLGLSAPEMTVLLGGLRVLGANHADRPHGFLTTRKGLLTNDFFVNLLDNAIVWEPVEGSTDEEFIGYTRIGHVETWRATRADLVFGSNSQLRATAEVYAESGNEEKFVRDFVKAWVKVMNADRFEVTA